MQVLVYKRGTSKYNLFEKTQSSSKVEMPENSMAASLRLRSVDVTFCDLSPAAPEASRPAAPYFAASAEGARRRTG